MKPHHKHLEKVARKRKIAETDLIQAYEIESEFHLKVRRETDPEVRERLFSEVYGRIHELHEKGGWHDRAAEARSKARLVRLFRKELEGKSVLDVGCGTGTFLRTIHTNLEHQELIGIDLSVEILPLEEEHIQFIQGNVIDFKMDKKFDVVFSDNVIEHIAFDDLSTHLRSIKNALKPGGTLIVITPNRLFGPSDITIITDSTYTNRVGAVGTHLNETTYSEMISILQEHGFSSFRTTIPTVLLKNYSQGVRISPKYALAIESRKNLLRAIYKLDAFSILLSRLPVILVCNYFK